VRIRENKWSRPTSLQDVVLRASTPEDIGYNLDDFLDQMNLMSKKRASRRQLFACIRNEPPLTGDAVQDAYLAAVADHLAGVFQLPVPDRVHNLLGRCSLYRR
jgi:hypothetical protein